MRDRDVRGALYRDLHVEHAAELENTRFVDELGICGEVRVDVVVLNGALSGYELKSASDTLRRLPKQVEFYSKVMDYATLVVAECHADAARRLVPDWWGVTIARSVGEEVELCDDRKGLKNPSIDPVALALLLWKDEALEALTVRGIDRGVRSKSRSIVCEKLAVCIELDELRDTVREQLKRRVGWRSDVRL